MNKNLLFLDSAVKETLQEIKKIEGFLWIGLRYINHNRYCIVYGTKENIAILLKTEPFFNFGATFSEEQGVGDSINVEHLREMIQADVKTIYTKFRDGKLYKAGIKEILLNSHKWTQKEGTEVRSFSIHIYKRVN